MTAPLNWAVRSIGTFKVTRRAFLSFSALPAADSEGSSEVSDSDVNLSRRRSRRSQKAQINYCETSESEGSQKVPERKTSHAPRRRRISSSNSESSPLLCFTVHHSLSTNHLYSLGPAVRVEIFNLELGDHLLHHPCTRPPNSPTPSPCC